ncbi:BIRC2_3 [Mytilus coruscus]|uniref:BIRC2_3 n=1 Tax=Mytilus coruscus TaxID=42192 RepID=A0A6J8EE96_MYTCO|nr:BIRC2_3 [Mytilus coruscus]
MIPVITSDEVDLPFCLSSVIPFQAWDDDWSKLRLALRKSDPSDKGNARLELFCQVFGKVLHLRIIEMEEELRQKDKVAMDVLRGWGLDIHDDKVNFHINTLLGIGNTQPICLLNLFNSLFHQKQFKFIRICDIKRFDPEGLQINKQLNSDLFEIFETLRRNVCKQSWYHYRRNGIRHNESSELSLNPFKQNNAKKHEEGRKFICFPKFKTFQSRVDIFEDFPIQVKEFRIKLSRAGFFNLHTSDYVQCFSCGGCIRSWSSDADPMVAHKKYYQNCTFILSKNMDVSSGHSTKICNEDLKTIEGRVHSFKQNLKAKTSYCIDDDVINRFTEAGFYYCGIAEDVICHSCNLGLANIQNCLQPMKLHRKLSPDCSYLKNFIDNTVDSGADVSYEIEPYLEIETRKHENI